MPQGISGQMWRECKTITATTAAGRYKFNGVLHDLTTLLSNMAEADGTEIKIHRATLDLILRAALTFSAEVTATVAVSAIGAGTDPGENSYFGDLADDLDVMHANNFSMQLIGTGMSSEFDSALHKVRIRADITSLVRQIAARTIREPESAEKYSAICLTGVAANSNPSIFAFSRLELWYSKVPKALRLGLR